MLRSAPQLITVVILSLLVLPALRGPVRHAEASRTNAPAPLTASEGNDQVFLVYYPLAHSLRALEFGVYQKSLAGCLVLAQ